MMGFKAKTPAAIEAYDLVDLDYAKRVVGGFDSSSPNYNKQDILIGDLIHAASLICTGGIRSYKYQEYTELDSGHSSGKCLFVESPPIDAGKTTKVWQGRNIDYEFDDDHLLTEHQHYEIWHEMGKIEFRAVLADGVRNYQIEYWGGYQAGKVPQDLMIACALIVADIYQLPNDRRHSIISQSRDGFSTSYSQAEIPERAQRILRRYIPEVGA